LSQRVARGVLVRNARWTLNPSHATRAQRDAHRNRVRQLQSNWALSISCNEK